MSRSLYDQEYLDSNCVFSVKEETFVDNNAWTEGTGFAVMTVCFAAFVKLYFFPQRRSHSSRKCYCRRKASDCLVPAYFLFTGLSHGIFGIGRDIVEETTDPRKRILEIAAQLVACVASIVVLVLGLTILGTTPKSKSTVTKALWWMVVVSFAAENLCAVVFNHEIFAGIDLHSLVSYGILLFLLMLYIAQAFKDKANVCHYCIKAGALLTVLIGLCCSYLLYPPCGSLQAYKQCFQDCPLPNGINHNALFNIVVIVGLSGWAWSEDRVPSIRPRKIVIPDDLTVASSGSDSESMEDIEEGYISDNEKVNAESLQQQEPESDNSDEAEG